MGIITEVRGKIEKEGQTTLDAQIITNFVALLPQDQVTISQDAKSVTIKGGTHKTKLNTLAAEEYPVIPEVERTQGFKVNVNDFKKALSQVVPAASMDDTRPEIHGLYMVVNGSSLTLVATDSYRLAEKQIEISDGGYSGSIIPPLKTMKEVLRIVDDEAEMLEVFVTENQIVFSANGTAIVSRLVEGTYPDYKQIIPNAHKLQFRIARDEMMNAVKISSLFATQGSNSVTIRVDPSKKSLSISSATSVGEEETTLTIDVDGDTSLTIIFDYRYLLDGLQAIESDEVVFSASSESSPTLLEPGGESPEKIFYVVMPIRQ